MSLYHTFTFLWLKCWHKHPPLPVCLCEEVREKCTLGLIVQVCVCLSVCVDEAGVYFEGRPIWPLWCHRCCVCSWSECTERLVCHLCYEVLSWPVCIYMCVEKECVILTSLCSPLQDRAYLRQKVFVRRLLCAALWRELPHQVCMKQTWKSAHLNQRSDLLMC